MRSIREFLSSQKLNSVRLIKEDVDDGSFDLDGNYDDEQDLDVSDIKVDLGDDSLNHTVNTDLERAILDKADGYKAPPEAKPRKGARPHQFKQGTFAGVAGLEAEDDEDDEDDGDFGDFFALESRDQIITILEDRKKDLDELFEILRVLGIKKEIQDDIKMYAASSNENLQNALSEFRDVEKDVQLYLKWHSIKFGSQEDEVETQPQPQPQPQPKPQPQPEVDPEIEDDELIAPPDYDDVDERDLSSGAEVPDLDSDTIAKQIDDAPKKIKKGAPIGINNDVLDDLKNSLSAYLDHQDPLYRNAAKTVTDFINKGPTPAGLTKMWNQMDHSRNTLSKMFDRRDARYVFIKNVVNKLASSIVRNK